jgi:regulator of protease activity HflC (stomatin/prohibitin superfamily)
MSKVGEIIAGTAVELFFLALALGILYRVWGIFFALPQRRAVSAFERGVIIVDGRVVEKVLNPGVYWIRPQRTLVLCDLRPKPFQIVAQELLTADGGAVRVSLGGEYRIASPAAFALGSIDPFGALYLEARQALRNAAGELTSHDCLSRQTSLVFRVKELLAPRAAQLGLELMQLDAWEVVPLRPAEISGLDSR